MIQSGSGLHELKIEMQPKLKVNKMLVSDNKDTGLRKMKIESQRPLDYGWTIGPTMWEIIATEVASNSESKTDTCPGGKVHNNTKV